MVEGFKNHSLYIKEEENTLLKINPAKMSLDDRLDTDKDPLPDPLPNSSFAMALVGSSGSGKTSLMSSIVTSNVKNGVRQSYRKLFSKIILCSPTLASFKNDIWGKIPKSQKFETFSLDFLEQVEEIAGEAWKENRQTLVILDDIGATLKRDRKAETKLVSMLQNRRHIGLSVIMLIQKWRDLPTGVRANLTNVALFRPKNNLEKEAIFGELLPMSKNKWDYIYDYVYNVGEDKYSFLFIDMSLKQDSVYRYFKKFNRILLTEKD